MHLTACCLLPTCSKFNYNATNGFSKYKTKSFNRIRSSLQMHIATYPFHIYALNKTIKCVANILRTVDSENIKKT